MYNNNIFRSTKPSTRRFNTDQYVSIDKQHTTSGGAPRYNQATAPSQTIPLPGPIDPSKIEELLWTMEKDCLLTIYLGRDPDFYLELIRLHFKRILEKDPSKKILNLQAIGQSVQNLVFVACLIELKKYAKLKRITNDSISTRGLDPSSGFETNVKKVRLQVTIEVSDNF